MIDSLGVRLQPLVANVVLILCCKNSRITVKMLSQLIKVGGLTWYKMSGIAAWVRKIRKLLLEYLIARQLKHAYEEASLVMIS